jgi:hypothetical protein
VATDDDQRYRPHSGIGQSGKTIGETAPRGDCCNTGSTGGQRVSFCGHRGCAFMAMVYYADPRFFAGIEQRHDVSAAKSEDGVDPGGTQRLGQQNAPVRRVGCDFSG